ncbi:MAG: ABC transporter ATP-binding protein [Alphaproteobacteria bacterium]
MSNILNLKNINKIYDQGEQKLSVLNGLNLAINKNEIVALVGPSGSGKTTLLQIAGMLDTPTSGEVWIGEENVATANDLKRTALRRVKVGFVYQFHHLLPEFSALENVMLSQMIAGVSSADAAKKSQELLGMLGLAERLTHRPAKLSGGEQQRVAIARALANDPALLLADEPTGNLDAHTAEGVFILLMKVMKERGLAGLVATHNMELAARMSRTVHLKDGKIA